MKDVTKEIVKADLLSTNLDYSKLHHPKKKMFVQAYRATLGHITNSCMTVGIERKTYYNWLEKDEAFRELILHAEYELNDDVREVLISKAAEGDLGAVIFYLKNRHPDFKQQNNNYIQVNIKPILGGTSVQSNDSNQQVVEAQEEN